MGERESEGGEMIVAGIFFYLILDAISIGFLLASFDRLVEEGR